MPDTSSPSTGTLHTIRWQEICPWLILVKALQVTLMIRVLVLATLGVLLTQWGDATIDRVLPREMSSLNRTTQPTIANQLIQIDFDFDQPNGKPLMQPLMGAFLRGWRWVTLPFWRLADSELSWQSSLVLLLHGLWTIVVWGVFGGAISRIAARYLTRGETMGPLEALRDAITIWPGTTGAPLIVLLVATILAIPLVLLGWLIRLNSFAVVAGLLWVIGFAWGLMLAVILVGLLFGWPLMWACLGVERSDAFDGVSRCYAYVYQRPLHLAFFVLVAATLTLLGEAVVNVFATATIMLSEGALSLGAGQARLNELLTADPSRMANQAINGWKWAFTSLVDAYPLACLWPMAVGIYLLLRRQVDATELDEITLSEVTLSANVPQSLPPRDPIVPE